MNQTHTKEGIKALNLFNWSIGPELKEKAEADNIAFILTEKLTKTTME